MFLLARPIWVFCRLVPFVISFIRDWHSFLFWGDPRVLTMTQHRDRARRLTRTLGQLGPAFIKGAQVLATREDILPRVYTQELKTLQDRVPPFPVEEGLRIISRETGRPAAEVFDSFDPNPLAAASLGQVHRAIYKGRAVAVKILRPNVERIVETDIAVVSFLIHILHFFIDSHFIRSFWEIHKEFRRMIRQEMDFRFERIHADRLRRILACDPRFLIPECAAELTTRRLAVFDFVEGVRVDDAAGLERCGLTPHELVSRLIEGYVRMTIIGGFVHADPHPGNLLVTPDGRIVILDYGMALEFPNETRLLMLKGCFAIVAKDLDTLVDCFYRLRLVDPEINRALVRDAAETLLRIQLRDDFTPRLIQDIAEDILNTFHRFPVRMPQQLVFLFRALALIEGLGMYYDKHFSAVREGTPVIKRLIRDIELEPDRPLFDRVVDVGRDTWSTLRHVRQIIERLEREEQRVRLHPADLERMQHLLGALAKRLLWGAASLVLILAALIVGFGHHRWIVATLLALPGLFGLLIALLLPLRQRDRLK